MLTEQDQAWLAEEYPGLAIAEGTVSGVLGFTASYNEQTDRFFIIKDGRFDKVPGLILTGVFEVRIEAPADPTKLPSLYVSGIEHIQDRHFNQTDDSACLCSPLDEDDFLVPVFEFKKYLEQLVIPFLYGQVFFDSEERWPWFEYAHGATGVLEAYFKRHDSTKVSECILNLKNDWLTWPRIKSALLQKVIKGHTPCVCEKRGPIRRCHPSAWHGIRRLQHDIRTEGIALNY